jgi:hypothetical protein
LTGDRAERGLSVDLNVATAHPALGGDAEGSSVSASFRGYWLTPWLKHHVLGLFGTLSAREGSGFGDYVLGGYQNPSLLRDLVGRTGQVRESLRGYPARQFWGNRLVLGRAEYRFPLLYVDRGYSTLPLFSRSVSAAFGVDVGGAFFDTEPRKLDSILHWGFAGELWFDCILAYRLPALLALGYAIGKGDGAYPGGTSYFVAKTEL